MEDQSNRPTTAETVLPQWVDHLVSHVEKISEELDSEIKKELASPPKSIVSDK